MVGPYCLPSNVPLKKERTQKKIITPIYIYIYIKYNTKLNNKKVILWEMGGQGGERDESAISVKGPTNHNHLAFSPKGYGERRESWGALSSYVVSIDLGAGGEVRRGGGGGRIYVLTSSELHIYQTLSTSFYTFCLFLFSLFSQKEVYSIFIFLTTHNS